MHGSALEAAFLFARPAQHTKFVGGAREKGLGFSTYKLAASPIPLEHLSASAARRHKSDYRSHDVRPREGSIRCCSGSVLDCFGSRLHLCNLRVATAGAIIAPATIERLKTQPQRELHLPSRIGADGLPECGIGLLPAGVKPCGGVDGIELRVIECVVDLPTESQHTRVAG